MGAVAGDQPHCTGLGAGQPHHGGQEAAEQRLDVAVAG